MKERPRRRATKRLGSLPPSKGNRVSGSRSELDCLQIASADIPRLVDGRVDVVGVVALAGVAVVEDAVDRLGVGGQQQVEYAHRGVVGHAEGVTVAADVDRRCADT